MLLALLQVQDVENCYLPKPCHTLYQLHFETGMITVQYDQFYGATTANNKIHGAKARTGQSFVQCSL